MNYTETLDWMFSKLPMYQRQGASAYKTDLSNSLALSDYLERPETSYQTLHVGGTNGKGSTSHMLAAVLQEAGYKVGLYTSPHLKDFRERIRVNGQPIDRESVLRFIDDHRRFLEDKQLSFFEMTVGLAFDHFKKASVDIAIIEVGLGGRLDATNIIHPVLSVITNIGLDHTRFLGTTLPEIALEKAGIIKTRVPVVIGEYQETVQPIFEQVAQARNAPLYLASKSNLPVLTTDLQGAYQSKNVLTAIQAVQVLNGLGFSITDQSLAAGLQQVVSHTGLLGRWQVLQQAPKVICDTAHNREGLSQVLAQLQEVPATQVHMVLGMVNDKDLETLLPLFPVSARYYFCKPDIPRGLDAAVLQARAKEYQLSGETYTSVSAAYHSALEKADKEALVFVGGSTFVVAEVL